MPPQPSTAALHKVTGNQTFKFGLDYRRHQGSELGRQTASGVFDFANTDTRGLTADGSVITGTGSDLASFLLGQADRARVQANPSFGRRSGYIAGFFQDDWRVNGQLTLNLGVRYEYEGPFTEVADRITGRDPGLALPAAGTNGIRHDQTGGFVFSPVYEVPLGRGKLIDIRGPLIVIAGGWQISGIYTFQGGSPFGVTVLNGTRDVKGDNAADATLYANLIGDPDHPSRGEPALGGRRGVLWTNEGGFESPARYTLGNAGRKVRALLAPVRPISSTLHYRRTPRSLSGYACSSASRRLTASILRSSTTREIMLASPVLVLSTQATRTARCSSG